MERAEPTRRRERFLKAQQHWAKLRPQWHPRDGPADDVRGGGDDGGLLSPEEAWSFDVHGFLIVRGALRGSVLAECQALSRCGVAPLGLATHPVAVRFVEQLCGLAWHLDGPVDFLGAPPPAQDPPGSPGAATTPYLLQGGGTPHEPSTSYHHQGGSRWAQGLRLIWALEDCPSGSAGGVVLLPASHTLRTPIPDRVRRGQDSYLESLGMELQPALAAGDMLVHAASLAHGVRRLPTGSVEGAWAPKLCSAEYRAVYARPSDPSRDVALCGDEPWLSGLGPVQRCVLGLPPAASYGCEGAGGGASSVGDWPALRSDGQTTRLETAEEVAARAGRPYHPGLRLLCHPDPTVDEMEFFYYELTGFLVVRNALSPSHLAAMNAVVAQRLATVDFGAAAQQRTPPGSSRRMAGSGRPDLDLMQLSAAEQQPFLELLAHPALVQRLSWMLGGHFRTESLGRLILSRRGTMGQALHGNGDPIYPANSWWDYTHDLGRLHTGQINAAWQLVDVGPEEQGFVVVPGSHHARLPLPSNDSGGDPAGHQRVLHPRMFAGDLLLFAGGATTHGAWAWESDVDRRVVLNAYWSRGMARQGWARGTDDSTATSSSKL